MNFSTWPKNSLPSTGTNKRANRLPWIFVSGTIVLWNTEIFYDWTRDLRCARYLLFAWKISPYVSFYTIIREQYGEYRSEKERERETKVTKNFASIRDTVGPKFLFWLFIEQNYNLEEIHFLKKKKPRTSLIYLFSHCKRRFAPGERENTLRAVIRNPRDDTLRRRDTRESDTIHGGTTFIYVMHYEMETMRRAAMPRRLVDTGKKKKRINSETRRHVEPVLYLFILT